MVPGLVTQLINLFAALLLLLSFGLLLAAPALVLKLAVGGAGLALIETLSAKMRIFRVPEFLAGAFLLAVIGILVHFLLGA